jgi:hypothetical protein
MLDLEKLGNKVEILENTVSLRRRMKQIYGENTDSRID